MFNRKDKSLIGGAGKDMLSNSAHYDRWVDTLKQSKNFDWGDELPYLLGKHEEPSFGAKIESPPGFEWNYATLVGQTIYCRDDCENTPTKNFEEKIALGNYRICFFNISYNNRAQFEQSYEIMGNKLHGRQRWRTKEAHNMLTLENYLQENAHLVGSANVLFDENNTSVIFSGKKQELETMPLRKNQWDHRYY